MIIKKAEASTKDLSERSTLPNKNNPVNCFCERGSVPVEAKASTYMTFGT